MDKYICFNSSFSQPFQGSKLSNNQNVSNAMLLRKMHITLRHGLSSLRFEFN